jgi:hypothetical protein
MLMALSGHIDTPGPSVLMSDEQKASTVTNVPLGRMGTPDDMGKVAVFLNACCQVDFARTFGSGSGFGRGAWRARVGGAPSSVGAWRWRSGLRAASEAYGSGVARRRNFPV